MELAIVVVVWKARQGRNAKRRVTESTHSSRVNTTTLCSDLDHSYRLGLLIINGLTNEASDHHQVRYNVLLLLLLLLSIPELSVLDFICDQQPKDSPLCVCRSC